MIGGKWVFVYYIGSFVFEGGMCNRFVNFYGGIEVFFYYVLGFVMFGVFFDYLRFVVRNEFEYVDGFCVYILCLGVIW